ncbi:MAG: type VI secretion system amidase effector protein Tae4 [Betaproteobacteria bacterium]|nr:type VI secretion system amidase effector protein Tae4 [Betaproteobacteria bacterium]
MTRPSFDVAWHAATKIYDPTSPAEKVAETVGGDVAAHIRDKKNPWRNTCAVRMSYILNKSAVVIPGMAGKTKKGRSGQNYFYRVRDLIAFLKLKWGAPEIVNYPPSGGGPLIGKTGVILFEVQGWSDANGHATLFNGRTCYDACYFNEPEATYRTTKANFWELE